MMDECNEELGTGSNPFDEPEIADELISSSAPLVSTPKTPQPVEQDALTEPSEPTNPFASGKDSLNPFETDDQSGVDEQDLQTDYEHVPLAGQLTKSVNRDWEDEWDQVAGAVKKNFMTVNVAAPEVVSSMMTKYVSEPFLLFTLTLMATNTHTFNHF